MNRNTRTIRGTTTPQLCIPAWIWLCLAGVLAFSFGVAHLQPRPATTETRQDDSNPYLAEFLALPPSYHRSGPLVNGAEARREREFHETRRRLVTTYSWAVPNEAALACIAKHSPRGVIDFGAAGGYWASLLARRGVPVVALDNWQDGRPDKLWFTVSTGSYEQLSDHPEKTLLLVWPPQATPMAVTAVRSWKGDTLVYIGEPPPARSTASPEFFQELAAHWRLVEVVKIPQWFNHSDALFVYKRLSPP